MARTLLWLALILCASLTVTTCAGLHLELTHVDAKEGFPLGERLRRATERTHRRLASMAAAGVTAPVHWAGTNQYIAEYLIGDPPLRAEAIIDTGSNLIWTQCATCRTNNSCFPQNLPLYDPSQSSSVRAVACKDAACAFGFETTKQQCARGRDMCHVLTGYGFGSISGPLDTETFTFGSSENDVSSLAFGCIDASDIATGTLNNASGIIGLGRGKLSLVSQLGETRFSYCLTPYFSDATSHLFVGASAGGLMSSGNNAPVATSVPFVESPRDDPFSSFYYLPLAGITVGQVKLHVHAAAFHLRQVAPGGGGGGGGAGTLIDSVTPFTRLVHVAYQALRAELVRQLGASNSTIVPPPEGFDLCVAAAQGDAGKVVPPLVLHFGGGGAASDLVVPPENYWGPVDENTACMVVYSAAHPNATLPLNETTIIGNYMHQNMHVLYDFGNGVLSFQPADCSSV